MADGRLSSITRIERVAILGAAIKEQYQLGPQRSHERPDAHVPLLPLPVAVVASATPTAPVSTGSSIKAVSDFQAIASLLRPQPDLHHRLCYRTNSFIYEERVLCPYRQRVAPLLLAHAAARSGCRVANRNEPELRSGVAPAAIRDK